VIKLLFFINVDLGVTILFRIWKNKLCCENQLCGIVEARQTGAIRFPLDLPKFGLGDIEVGQCVETIYIVYSAETKMGKDQVNGRAWYYRPR